MNKAGWSFHEGELDRNDVRDLLEHHWNEMREGHPPEACHVLEPDKLAHSAIHFFTLRDRSGQLLGFGALQELDERHGEVKSMRVSKSALGRGAGQALLDHIIEAARDMGMTRLSLETGKAPIFESAVRLYERNGFRRCEPFGAYTGHPFTRYYTREI